jgi:hypothetical protein
MGGRFSSFLRPPVNVKIGEVEWGFAPAHFAARRCAAAHRGGSTASNVWSFGWPRSTPSGMRACWWAFRNASERVQASNADRLSQVECET